MNPENDPLNQPALPMAPEFASPFCRAAAAGLTLLLNWGPLAAALAAGYLYGWTVAVATGVFGMLASGIATSKMRFAAVPPEAGETVHKTGAVVRWFLSRGLCLEEGRGA